LQAFLGDVGDLCKSGCLSSILVEVILQPCVVMATVLVGMIPSQQSPSIWGAILWELLHAIGVRTGRSPHRLRADELRTLRWLVNHLESIVPCQECRAHIEEYRRFHPPPDESPGDYNEWFWQFHEAVNQRLGKVGISFSEVCSRPQRGVIETWKEFLAIVKLPAVSVKAFDRHIRLWMGFAGI
jgi:hypothetical protein